MTPLGHHGDHCLTRLLQTLLLTRGRLTKLPDCQYYQTVNNPGFSQYCQTVKEIRDFPGFPCFSQKSGLGPCWRDTRTHTTVDHHGTHHVPAPPLPGYPHHCLPLHAHVHCCQRCLRGSGQVHQASLSRVHTLTDPYRHPCPVFNKPVFNKPSLEAKRQNWS